MGLSWVSLGSLLLLSWVSFGSLLGLSWVSLGFILGLSWVSLRSLLVLSWVSLGSLLVLYWVFLGSLLGLLLVSTSDTLGGTKSTGQVHLARGRGRSLVLRSHDQIPASHWSVPRSQRAGQVLSDCINRLVKRQTWQL